MSENTKPIVDIFIRTYHKDLPWLTYCLSSIHKYCTGFRDIIVVIPESQKKALDGMNLTKEKTFVCPDYKDDYLGQQITKLYADDYSDAHFICFGDSDTLVSSPLTPEIITGNGRPLILKTDYNKVGDGIIWKDVTEKTLGFPIEFEFMRRHPFCYHGSTLKALRTYIKQLHGKELKDYVKEQPRFSEFNTIGAFADKFEHDKYKVQNTDDGLPPLYMRQFRSWDGITDNTMKEITEILK